MKPLTNIQYNRLAAVYRFVVEKLERHSDGEVIEMMINHHSARLLFSPSGNVLRAGGVVASCTWSRDTGLLRAWRRNAAKRLFGEA